MKNLLFAFLICLPIVGFSQEIGEKPLDFNDYRIGVMFCDGEVISVEFNYNKEGLKREIFIEDNKVMMRVSSFDKNKNLVSVENYIFGSFKDGLCWLAHGEHVKFNGNAISDKKNFVKGWRVE